jgi:hypothetical protein
MASSPENKMVSFVGNPTLKFFNTVWWLSIGAAHEKSKKRFPRERFESRFSVVSRLFAAQKKHLPFPRRV